MAEHTRIQIAELDVDVYNAGGTKATLMFTHGAWVGGWVWEGFAPWFADQGYACYCPTWRGHYDSKPVPDIGQVSMHDFVEDALAVARSINPDAVIGESMGGLIAQKVAESVSLKALVLMNSVPPFMVPASPRVLKSQFKYLGDLLGNKPNKPTYEDYKLLILNNVHEDDARKIYARICPDSGRAIKEMSLGKVKVDVNKVKSPVYVVAGHLDAILPIKVHRKMAKMYGAEIAEYPSMSHHTFSEEGWETVASELAVWLGDKLGAPVHDG
ncbi:MAG: alpha/beta hydrolase [Actinomycetota bacterium]